MKNNPLAIVVLIICLSFIACQHSGNIYKWDQTPDGWTLYESGKTVGLLVPFYYENITASDRIEALKSGVFKITRTFSNTGETALDSVRLTLDVVHQLPTSYNMIPAVSYNGNTWGKGKEPKGFEHEGAFWSFSSRSTSIPGATYSESDAYAVALWGVLEKGSHFSCSLMPEKHRTTHRLIWPEEEQPVSYIKRDGYGDGYRDNLHLEPGESFTVEAILVAEKVKPNHKSISGFMREAWEIADKKRDAKLDPDKVWEYGVQYAKQYLWAEEGVYQGFSIGLVWRNDKWIQRPGWKYEIGWCGQNASLSNSLLVNYLKTGDEESKDKAITCLDTWAKYCPLPNGLFKTHFDYILGITKNEERLDACNLGTAALNYFEAHDLAAECGFERPEYREIALNICKFMVNDQLENGCYGKGWTPEGECLYRVGTIGAFLIAPMVKAYELTSDKRFLSSATAAFAFYFGELQKNGYTTAGALDTWCIDKESSMTLLRSAILFYDLTKDKKYLDAAEQISWYLSTWMWHYSDQYSPESDFVTYGYDTFGATSVSTQHHHLDPYALFWVKDWLDLAERTGDDIWREKALAIWYNGTQMISNGTMEIKGKIRPIGSQNEAFLQSHWSWNGKELPGMMNDWLVAWPGAFRLETLRRLEDWGELD